MKAAIIFSPDLPLTETEILSEYVLNFAETLKQNGYSVTVFSDCSFETFEIFPYKEDKFIEILSDYDVIHNFDNKKIRIASSFFKQAMTPVINTFSSEDLFITRQEVPKKTSSDYFIVNFPDNPEINELNLIENLVGLREKKYFFYSEGFNDKDKLEYYKNKNSEFSIFINKNEPKAIEILRETSSLIDLSENILIAGFCLNNGINVFTTSQKPASKFIKQDSFIFRTFDDFLFSRINPERQENRLPSLKEVTKNYTDIYTNKLNLSEKTENKLKIVFYANTSDFDGETPFNQELGGTESAAVYISRQLAKLGHKVLVFSHNKESIVVEGVHYHSRNLFNQYAENNNIDILITLRSIFILKYLKAKVIIFWSEDDADQPAVKEFIIKSKNGVLADKIFVVSDYQKQAFINEYRVDERKFYLTRNGINPEFFENKEKTRKRLIYTSTPYKGLKALVKIFPEIKMRVPEAELDIYSSMSIYGLEESDEIFRPLYQEIESTEGMNLQKPLSQPELAKKVQEALLFIYPNTFPETSCITALEAQAAGTPVITSWLGALPETVVNEKTGFCIEGNPFYENYQEEFINKTVQLMTDKEKWREFSKNGIERMKSGFTWEKITREWEEVLNSLLTEFDSLKSFIRFLDKGFEKFSVQEINSLVETFFFMKSNFSFVKLEYFYSKDVLEKYLKSGKLTDKNYLDLLIYLGDIYYLSGNKNKSLLFFEKVLAAISDKIEPDKNMKFLDIFCRTTECLLSVQKYNEALYVCKWGLDIFPSSYNLLFLLAETHKATGNDKVAGDIIDKLLKTFPPKYYLPELPKDILLFKIKVSLSEIFYK